ncbi:Transposase [Phytophthora megakarya]|uniref:Transposase n=1 Tax=Phytophthora megakarya TaxID=4795 RepID=A0A225V1A6_9STRA|nr:Transposase [Phytophthora megakarya]
MHQKLSSWLAANYKQVLLLSFHTSEMVRRHPEPDREGYAAQAHYRFKMHLKYKLERAGERLVESEEEYTSKTCSGCGAIKNNLGGSEIFWCGSCRAVFDRDLNAARNIFQPPGNADAPSPTCGKTGEGLACSSPPASSRAGWCKALTARVAYEAEARLKA